MYKHQKYIIVEHKSNLNNVLKNTCPFSNRIKFTCLDVSLNYIVFGATSGGLYIFKRYPHVLIKLIPSKHGAVLLLEISPNEEAIALTTSRNVIVIITNCFASSEFQYHTYREDTAGLVTAIKWNNNEELYYGNNVGKVGVITVPKLLAKAMFQTPRALLMQLDSSICQIDCHSVLLLISTLTRTYLCNTEKEHFMQIGKKIRNGKFGACFFMNTEAKLKSDNDQIIPNSNANVKIFCNRPKVRLWEAQLDATVSCTHQLKDFFKQNTDSWICLDSNDSHSSKLVFAEGKTESQESLNFTKMLVLQEKFILTFNSEGFYIFDPKTLTVISRYNNFSNIIDIKVANNFIYVCLENMDVHIFGLYKLENIILKTLFNQHYHACTEICINYYKEVLELIETSDRLYLLKVLENKLCECYATDIDNRLTLIFEALQTLSQTKISDKLNGGVVVVQNTYFNENLLNDNYEKTSKDQEILPEIDPDMKILLQQYEWSQINEYVKISKYRNLLDVMDPDKVVTLFQNFKQYMLQKSTDVELWAYNSYFTYFANLNFEQLILNEINETSLQFLVQGYCSINFSRSFGCACSYPLPSAKTKKPRYYDIGCAILNKLKSIKSEMYENVINDVPFMWKYVITHLKTEECSDNLLPLLMQLNDETVFPAFLNKFTYDTWDNAIQILIKLQQRKCINCEAEFDKNCVVIKWKELANFMLQSMGPQSTVALLQHYSPLISSEDLDAHFYQSCIFAAAFGNGNNESPSKAASMINPNGNKTLQMEELLAKYLTDKYRTLNHTH